MSLLRRFWRWLQLIVPFGLLVRTKPRHYREMLRVLWRNRGRWRYAMRILQHGGYQVEVSHRGALTFSRDELGKQHWNVAARL